MLIVFLHLVAAESMAELPVIVAAINLVIEIALVSTYSSEDSFMS